MLKRFIIMAGFLLSLLTFYAVASNRSNPKVYLLAQIEIRNKELYSKYVERVPAVIAKYGGRYLIRGGKVTSQIGGWNPERLILIEFENMEQMNKCFNSPEYLEIAPFREQSTVSKAVIVEGYLPPE